MRADVMVTRKRVRELETQVQQEHEKFAGCAADLVVVQADLSSKAQ